MNNQWRIENVRNPQVIVNFARDRSYRWQVHSPKEYLPDDTRCAVVLTGLTWSEMQHLMERIGEQIDADCPPVQWDFEDTAGVSVDTADDAVDGNGIVKVDKVLVTFPAIEAAAE